MVDWMAFKGHRDAVVAERGEWACLLDQNYEPIMDLEDSLLASWPGVYNDAGSMSLVLDGEVMAGVQNPVVEELLISDLSTLDQPRTVDALFHKAVHVAVKRKGDKRIRCYRVLDLIPEGGRDFPAKMTVTGMDTMEQLKHLPCWADPSNRSKIVQLQFSDIQSASAEDVSRRIIGRNLFGYQQPSLLRGSMDWTANYGSPEKWRSVIPDLHSVMVSPISSGLPSEWAIVEARWDNAWDLLKATWDASGVMPISYLWLPGEDQPFPTHTILSLPTVIIDFIPRSTVTGAAGLFGQGWQQLQRMISPDDHMTSVVALDDVPMKNSDGQLPWVVFDIPEAPKMVIRKSTDHTFLVGGKSPKIVNDVLEAGIKAAFAGLLSMLPGIGPLATALISGAGDLIANMSADRFLNLNEFTDQNRKAWHGRSGYKAVSKPGEANSLDALQKAWQAKTETAGGLSIEFMVDDPYPYVPGRDFDIGDIVGVRCWGVVWAAYVSELTWVSEPGNRLAYKISLGNLEALADPARLFQLNVERVRAVIGRLATYISN